MGTLGALLGAGTGLLGGTNSDSNSQGTSVSDSWGASGSSNYNFGDSWNLGGSSARSRSDAYEWSWGDSESNSWGENYSNTYGSAATAKDIELAREQNALQQNLWNQAADYNAKQAEADRAWQERMSNTAYQRAVKDLLAAGLNPILAVGNMGASTPVGAMTSMAANQAYRANVQADSMSYGSSGSNAWSRNRGEGGSRSRSSSESWNAGKSHNEGGGSSWSSEGSHSESQNTSESKTRTQLASAAEKAVDLGKDAIGFMGNLVNNGGSAKSSTNDAKHEQMFKNHKK